MSRVPPAPTIALAVLATLSLLTVLMLPALAGEAGVTYGGHERVEFSYEGNPLECVDGFEYEVRDSGLDGTVRDNTAIGLGVTVTDGTDVAVTIEDLEGGTYQFTRTCASTGEFEVTGKLLDFDRRTFSFSRVLLTKDIVGDAPTDAAFTAQVACDQVETPVSGSPWTRDFTATGGQSQVVFYLAPNASCDITEPAPGGADDVAVAPATLAYDGFSDGSSTVTNTFTVAEPSPSPSPSPSPTPEPSPSPEEAEPVEVAEPAEAVDADADFTG